MRYRTTYIHLVFKLDVKCTRIYFFFLLLDSQGHLTKAFIFSAFVFFYLASFCSTQPKIFHNLPYKPTRISKLIRFKKKYFRCFKELNKLFPLQEPLLSHLFDLNNCLYLKIMQNWMLFWISECYLVVSICVSSAFA